MLKYAIIVAGGYGNRMNSSIPKQFLSLRGKPVLLHTLEVFLSAFNDINLVVVLPEQHFSHGKSLIESLPDSKNIQLVIGGTTRFHSVKNGLRLIPENS